VQVTFADAASAQAATQNPNPVIDNRRANCNLAALGAKPKGAPMHQGGGGRGRGGRGGGRGGMRRFDMQMGNPYFAGGYPQYFQPMYAGPQFYPQAPGSGSFDMASMQQSLPAADGQAPAPTAPYMYYGVPQGMTPMSPVMMGQQYANQSPKGQSMAPPQSQPPQMQQQQQPQQQQQQRQ
jgi:hypothetical protein